MSEPAALPPGHQWLVPPHRFRYAGNTGQLSECIVSAAKRGGDPEQIYVLCSEPENNHGTRVTYAWGPAISLEAQVRTHILTEADAKLERPHGKIYDGWHYHISEEALAGWHFFEHHSPHPGERDSCVYPVAVPFGDDDALLGASVDFASQDPGALLRVMAREVRKRGFAVKEVWW